MGGLGRASAKHDTASEDSGLAAVVRGNVSLGGVDVDATVLGLVTAGGSAALLRRVGAVGRWRGRGVGVAIRGAGVGGARAAPGVRRAVVGQRGGGASNGERDSAPVGVVDEMEDLLVLIVVLEELLSDSLAGAEELVLGIRERGETGARGGEGRSSDGAGPEGGEHTGSADCDTPGVDEKLKLDAAEDVNPLEPLDACCDACVIDRPGGETCRGEDECATSGAAKRLLDGPGGGVEGGEGGVKGVLELADAVGGVGVEEGSGEAGDGMGDGDGEVCGGHG